MSYNKAFITIKHDNLNLSGIYTHNSKTEIIAVMLHGFTGTKTEAHYNYKRLSETLIKNNIATLRFDYLGSGESDGEFSTQTKDYLLAQIDTIVNYAQMLDYKNIVLIGYSMSGYLVLETAYDFINDVVLINPALNMGDILVDLFKQKKPLTKTRVDLDGLILTQSMVDSFQVNNVVEASTLNYQSIMILQSINDNAVPIKHSKNLIKKHPYIKSVIIDSDHTISDYHKFKVLESNVVDFLK